jgi:hypothetical protein
MSSTACSFVDGGMRCSGKLLPTRKSFVVALLEATMDVPTCRPSGARM